MRARAEKGRLTCAEWNTILSSEPSSVLYLKPISSPFRRTFAMTSIVNTVTSSASVWHAEEEEKDDEKKQ